MMNKNTAAVLALAITPLAAFAQADDWKGGQFEANAIYGRTDSKLGNTNFYGGTVAGGFYHGNHLFQLETGALISENFDFGFDVRTNPANPAQTFIRDFKRAEFQDVPIWVNYRYGYDFGTNDAIRLEVGPVVGARVTTFRTKYDMIIFEGSNPPQQFTGRSSQSGGVTFDYGLAATLRWRLADHWSLQAGYRYIRSLKNEFDARSRELGTATMDVFRTYTIPEHGTHYASVGVEYRF